MCYRLLLLLLLCTPLLGFAQAEWETQKNGIRIEYGIAAFRVDGTTGTYFGGVWSRQFSKRVNLEIVANHFDFSEGRPSKVLNHTHGWGIESNILYHFVNQRRIKFFLGAGLQASRLVYEYTTGSNTTATFHVRNSDTPILTLDENSSGSYSIASPGVTLLAGTKILIAKHYYLTIEPVLLPPPGPVLNTVRIGFEVRF